MKQNVGTEINIFLIGMLSGVMTAAAFTYVFAIPANNYYWKTEIWRRGGAAWTFDMKSGHMGWKWMADSPRQKRVTAPASAKRLIPDSARYRDSVLPSFL